MEWQSDFYQSVREDYDPSKETSVWQDVMDWYLDEGPVPKTFCTITTTDGITIIQRDRISVIREKIIEE